MELTQSMNVVLYGVGVMVMVYAWSLFHRFWLKPRKLERFFRKQGLKGNSYKFLYGDLKEMAQMTSQTKLKPINLTDDIIPRVMPFLHNLVKIYGKGKPIFTWMGPRPLVHITEPALIREVLTNYNKFQKRQERSPYLRLARGIESKEGDEWVKHRNIINPAFHVEKLKHMLPAFHISCIEMINKWAELTKERSCEVDVYPHLQMFTSDVISRAAFGSSYEEGRRIFELQEEQAILVTKASQSMYFPGSQYLPTKRNRRIKKIYREVKASIKQIIDKRMTMMKDGQSSNDDLLGILLDSNSKEIKQQRSNNSGLTIDEVIEEFKLFYFAGQETTANLLVWTMILLGQHTNWQDRARDEILKVFGERKVDTEGLSHLKVVNMILHEVLRLYPPGELLGRMIHEETTLGNITLPAGSFLHLHMMLLHHDSDIWGNDVTEFKPERFIDGVSKATKGQASYFPFGGGPRICIGKKFALVEAKLALVMILRHFSFDISPSYVHAPHAVMTIQPQFGAHLILHKL